MRQLTINEKAAGLFQLFSAVILLSLLLRSIINYKFDFIILFFGVSPFEVSLFRIINFISVVLWIAAIIFISIAAISILYSKFSFSKIFSGMAFGTYLFGQVLLVLVISFDKSFYDISFVRAFFYTMIGNNFWNVAYGIISEFLLLLSLIFAARLKYTPRSEHNESI
jgi:hypothetical protein